MSWQSQVSWLDAHPSYPVQHSVWPRDCVPNAPNEEVDQQLFSRLFRLPAELRSMVFRDVVPKEIILQSPSDFPSYIFAYVGATIGIVHSCKRAMYEVSGIPPPVIHLRLPSLDAESNAVLNSFPTHLFRTVTRITIQSPNWVVRPDRFQWSSDQAVLRFDAANRFLSRCIALKLLIIEVNGQSFSGLVNACLRQLMPLKVREGVEVGIEIARGPIPNKAMGPSPDTIEEVVAAIKGQTTEHTRVD